MTLKRLNSRERKKFYQQLEEQYGVTEKLDYEILLNENRMKYFFLTPETADFSVEGMRIETLGLYIARGVNDGLRLTIEGSQLFGPHAHKNIFLVDDEQHDLWIRGNDIPLETDEQGWILLKHNDDFIGCGKIVHKEEAGKTVTSIHNYIPKARYVRG